MRVVWETITLELRTTFSTAHGASDQRDNVLVRIQHQGRVGLGEAAGLRYLGESPEGVEADLRATAAALEAGEPDDPWEPAHLLQRLPRARSHAARAAVDMALHDLWGQTRGLPLWRLLGLGDADAEGGPGQRPADGAQPTSRTERPADATQPTSRTRLPPTSFTISLDTPRRMARLAREARMPILKLKLGGPGRREDDDEAAVAAVRAAVPEATIRVDANAGWNLEQATRLIPRLLRHGVELVEQPLAATDVDGLRELRDRVDAPIFGDESVRTAADIPTLSDALDGVVIKLMKCGGVLAAKKAIATARRHGLRIMMGCMVESSVGVTAAAQLAHLCDLTDLDGPLLLTKDPFSGLTYDGARITLSDLPGLGVRPRP